MELEYISEKLEKQCTSVKEAKKLFDGDLQLAVSLLARINALERAETLKDIVVQPTFHFHSLKNKNGRKNKEVGSKKARKSDGKNGDYYYNR